MGQINRFNQHIKFCCFVNGTLQRRIYKCGVVLTKNVDQGPLWPLLPFSFTF